MGRDQICPTGNLIDALAVLQGHRVADVCKLAILHQQEIVPLGQSLQVSDEFITEILHNVYVRLQQANVRTALVGHVQDLIGVCQVGGQAEVRLFAGYQVEEALGHRAFSQIGATLVGQFSPLQVVGCGESDGD